MEQNLRAKIRRLVAEKNAEDDVIKRKAIYAKIERARKNQAMLDYISDAQLDIALVALIENFLTILDGGGKLKLSNRCRLIDVITDQN